MDRRNFIKSAISIVGLPNIGKLKPSKRIKPREFDPHAEYGNEVNLNYSKALKHYTEPQMWDFLKKIAYTDMLVVVPEGYRYRVQFRTKVKDYGRILGLCWYYPPSGRYPVYCKEKFLGYQNKQLPLPVQHQTNSYGVI